MLNGDATDLNPEVERINYDGTTNGRLEILTGTEIGVVMPQDILHRRKKGFGIPRYYLKDLDGGRPTQEHLLRSLFL